MHVRTPGSDASPDSGSAKQAAVTVAIVVTLPPDFDQTGSST
jgi:hypothetical protein